MSGAFLPAVYLAGFRAGADYSALTDTTKYIAVQLDTDGDVVVAAAGEQVNIGFLQNKPADQEPAVIAGPGGGSKAIAAGTIAAGDFLKTDSSGHLLKISSETSNAVAIALESAVDNDVFNVLVLAPGYSVTIA